MARLAAAGTAAALLAAVPATASTRTTVLTGTVGPEDTITLTQAGRKVTRLPAGAYTIRIHDLASDHDFHLYGPGVNRLTSIGGEGAFTWRVRLRKGTYRYVCDPHANFMAGSLKIS